MELYTRQEAAQYLRIGLRTLDRRIAEGEIECHRYGDGPRAMVRISEEQLQTYLQKTEISCVAPDAIQKARSIMYPLDSPE